MNDLWDAALFGAEAMARLLHDKEPKLSELEHRIVLQAAARPVVREIAAKPVRDALKAQARIEAALKDAAPGPHGA